MRGFSWTHLILAILIIVFAKTTWLVIVLAAILAVLSIFGVCSCGTYKPKPVKQTAPRKKVKRNQLLLVELLLVPSSFSYFLIPKIRIIFLSYFKRRLLN